MRLGGPIHAKIDSPEEWVAAVKDLGYTAAYCPVNEAADDATVRAYEDAAAANDIVIAEVGAWSNPIAPDDTARNEAVEKCKAKLALADRIGARCCVNVSGSRGDKWAGPHHLDLTRETFDMIVGVTREIVDAVQPSRTWFALEPMPWSYPDSVASYVELIKAIDRDRFAVHFDPVNIVSSPQIYYNTGALISDFVEKLGPQIKSCHAKDIKLEGDLTVHLNEVRPGLGGLDYGAYLKSLAGLSPDLPLMLEHLSTAKEYAEAARHVRSEAQEAGVALTGS